MGAKGSLVGLIVQVIVMALAWQLIESGVFQGVSQTFQGKLMVAFIIILASKFLSKLLGG